LVEKTMVVFPLLTCCLVVVARLRVQVLVRHLVGLLLEQQV
jgi:hypothetical protein